ncbi:hypothetical protein EYF80_050894 [Liparis tanakae]|uniref:Uncharacterized protein n=1 Tax=Liparis tanakae TaxID=230148 RepID=A0A4Z2FDT4_9TELE|nr:hypothetical protein EYF80_050894 [Liparis tanakae]
MSCENDDDERDEGERREDHLRPVAVGQLAVNQQLHPSLNGPPPPSAICRSSRKRQARWTSTHTALDTEKKGVELRRRPPLFVSYVANPPSGFLMLSNYEEKEDICVKELGSCGCLRCRRTTLTASCSRSEATCSPMEGQSSCSSITDFRPSAVQSATIQPQSRRGAVVGFVSVQHRCRSQGHRVVPGSHHVGVVGLESQDPQGDVAQRCAHDGVKYKNMEEDGSATWEQEERSAVVPRPVAVLGLQAAVEAHAFSRGIHRRVGGFRDGHKRTLWRGTGD